MMRYLFIFVDHPSNHGECIAVTASPVDELTGRGLSKQSCWLFGWKLLKLKTMFAKDWIMGRDVPFYSFVVILSTWDPRAFKKNTKPEGKGQQCTHKSWVVMMSSESNGEKQRCRIANLDLQSWKWLSPTNWTKEKAMGGRYGLCYEVGYAHLWWTIL